ARTGIRRPRRAGRSGPSPWGRAPRSRSNIRSPPRADACRSGARQRRRHTGRRPRLFTWRSAAHARRGRDMTLRGIPARPNTTNLGLSAVGVVAALFLLIVAFGSFTQVGVGEVGIVKHFGAIDPEHPDVFDPGIHTKVPFRDDVVIFDTRI